MPAHDPDAYWEAISLRAADRASRYRTGGINQKFGRDGSRFTEIDKRFARRRSLDWVLTGGLGIVPQQQFCAAVRVVLQLAHTCQMAQRGRVGALAIVTRNEHQCSTPGSAKIVRTRVYNCSGELTPQASTTFCQRSLKRGNSRQTSVGM